MRRAQLLQQLSVSIAIVLQATDLELRYGPTVALAGATIAVRPGEVVALTGASGSGKSSLLLCLAALIRPTVGSVLFEGDDITVWSEAERSALRRQQFGFVFQFAELVPELSVRENIALPLELNGVGRRERKSRVDQMLERLGIEDQANRIPGQVSGGQAQRTAVARALIHEPAVVFADEPTGSLDSQTGSVVLTALLELAAHRKAAVVVASHDPAVAALADRRVTVRDGYLDAAVGGQ